MEYLKALKEKYPEIKPFEEEDDDWENYGYDALKKEEYDLAEMHFGKLCLSQPEHHSGFEGLAYTCYLMQEFDKAEFFMGKAIGIAKRFLEDDSIDIEIIHEMEENGLSIKNRKQLKIWRLQ